MLARAAASCPVKETVLQAVASAAGSPVPEAWSRGPTGGEEPRAVLVVAGPLPQGSHDLGSAVVSP